MKYKLKKNDILISLENNKQSNYYFHKNMIYKIIDDLPNFIEKSYSIIDENNFHFALSEEYILNNFNCLRYHRKEKLKRLKKISKKQRLIS